MLDYDKKFLLKSADNLTFDGSSIRGFSQQAGVRPAARRSTGRRSTGCPSDVFGPGKVLVFAEVLERDGTPYPADMRARLKAYTDELFAKDGTVCHAANEIEGFLFKGRDAERRYHETGKFEFISHRRLLPLAARRRAAHVHRHARPKCSARWASRTRRTTPRWRRRSSR